MLGLEEGSGVSPERAQGSSFQGHPRPRHPVNGLEHAHGVHGAQALKGFRRASPGSPGCFSSLCTLPRPLQGSPALPRAPHPPWAVYPPIGLAWNGRKTLVLDKESDPQPQGSPGILADLAVQNCRF